RLDAAAISGVRPKGLTPLFSYRAAPSGSDPLRGATPLFSSRAAASGGRPPTGSDPAVLAPAPVTTVSRTLVSRYGARRLDPLPARGERTRAARARPPLREHARRGARPRGPALAGAAEEAPRRARPRRPGRARHLRRPRPRPRPAGHVARARAREQRRRDRRRARSDGCRARGYS